MQSENLNGAPARQGPAQSLSGLRYMPGLDGLRALAVAAVLLYHSDLGWMPGGYLGVEIFFVISGYLITLLLLTEWRAKGAIDLKHFWLRRARRLLPALFVLLACALAFTVLFLPDEVAGLRADTLAALGYVTNWYLILAQKSYFESVGRPSLLRHLWSLAVEEQFYLLFPPLLLVLLKWWKPRRVFFTLLAGAAASATLMFLLYQPDVDPSRIYYGTDTRAGGLLIGAALAFIWTPWESASRQRNRWLLDAVGLAALGGLLFACIRLDEYEPLLYQGGFLAVALTTAIVIAVAVHPGAHLGTDILGREPLRWIGQRSYSLYLWHWLVFDLTRPQLDVPLDGVPLFVLQVAISLVLADLSFRWIETPFRSGALGRAWDNVHRARGAQRLRLGIRWAGAVSAIAIVSAVLGESVVSAQVPAPPAYLAFEHGAETSTPTAALDPTKTATAPASATPVPPTRLATATTVAHTVVPTAQPQQTLAVTAIGDSVMLGAATDLEHTLGPVQVDAAVGRQVSQAITLLQQLGAARRLGPVVVIHLGNNGTFSAQQFKTIMSLLANERRVVIVNDKVPRPWEIQNNKVLASEAEQYSNVVLVDLYAASAQHPEYFWNDGIHLRPEGAQVYADLIAAAVDGHSVSGTRLPVR